MTRYTRRNRPSGRAAATILVSTLALGVVPPALPGAQMRAATGSVPPLPGSVPVNLTVTLRLSGLHPAATQGALECGAIAQTRAWIDAHRESLVDYDSLYRWVLGPAHYYAEKALLEFPVANGSYEGTLTYATALSADALTDSSTRASFAPNPSIIVACWLQINGRPAAWNQGTRRQVVSSSNYAGVNQKPLVVAVAEIGAGAPVNATGQLSAQGLYFSPGPVALVENLEISGPNAPVSGLATAGSSPNAPSPASKQTAATSVAPSVASLATSSQPNPGWGTGKNAGVIDAVTAAFVQEIKTLIEAIESWGPVVTAEDQNELTTAASLADIEVVAVIVSAVVTVIEQLPKLNPPYVLPVYPVQVVDLSSSGASGTLPPQAYQLSPQQVQQVILSIPTPDASASRFTNDVKALLRKIKTRG